MCCATMLYHNWSKQDARNSSLGSHLPLTLPLPSFSGDFSCINSLWPKTAVCELGDVFYFGDKGGTVLIAFPAKPKVMPHSAFSRFCLPLDNDKRRTLSRYGKVYCHTGVVGFLLFSFHLFLIDFSICESEVFCLPISRECLPGDLNAIGGTYV